MPHTPIISANDWYDLGRRVWYHPIEKAIVPKKNTESAVAVFERTVGEPVEDDDRWITMMPGFPDGSYGYSRIESILSKNNMKHPRLYIEYVGQGDSDTPSQYNYGTMERADLVQAQWKAHNIRKTVLVTFDYSSIVMLELLRRQQESDAKGETVYTRIEHILSINGGLFADGHSHPILTTPLLKTWFGKVGAWMAQYSDFVFDVMLIPLWSKDYKVSKQELRETEAAIRRHGGALFLHYAADFVHVHKNKYSERWNLENIYHDYAEKNDITFHLVGSELDQFEYKQIDLAQKRLGQFAHVKVESIPGGHLSTSEQAEPLAGMIQSLADR